MDALLGGQGPRFDLSGASRHTTAMRRFIVCFDGTWNAPDKGANPTNVVKLVRAVANLANGISQVTFYDKGVGTGDVLDRIAGGASGKGLTEIMVDGYRFLANNYADGDEIYIFGFSRGAYTARSLTGFIGLAGLLSPLDLGSDLSQAIDVYRNSELSGEQKPEKIRELRLDRKQDVPIRCVGVWDTVGSLGIPGDLGRRLLGAKFDFHDVQLSPKVEIALHAVGVDEKRSAFAPTLWVRPKDAPAPAEQVVEQVWFPGVHSNVGGSYADAGLSDAALDWMIKRVQLAAFDFPDGPKHPRVRDRHGDPGGHGILWHRHRLTDCQAASGLLVDLEGAHVPQRLERRHG
jgi:uncharacterized protein (DUF2235 family)